jgi:hypothetical protein
MILLRNHDTPLPNIIHDRCNLTFSTARGHPLLPTIETFNWVT